MYSEPRSSTLRAHVHNQARRNTPISSSEVVDLIRESGVALDDARKTIANAEELQRRTKRMMDEFGV